jgi:hypothetical protein
MVRIIVEIIFYLSLEFGIWLWKAPKSMRFFLGTVNKAWQDMAHMHGRGYRKKPRTK